MTEPVKPHVENPIVKPEDKPPVTKPTPPEATQLPAPTKAERIKQLSDKLGDILKTHGGLESNVPMNHPYWGVKAELDVVRNLPE